jgi:hypothetical protein
MLDLCQTDTNLCPPSLGAVAAAAFGTCPSMRRQYQQLRLAEAGAWADKVRVIVGYLDEVCPPPRPPLEEP